MLKTLLKILAGLLTLLIVAGIAIVFFVPTEQWKTALENAVARNTGYQLSIAGDLDFNIFPTLALTLNDVRLRNPGSPQELASTSAVSLVVSGGELLNGRILIQEFLADDFHINYFVDADGNSAWIVEGAPAAEQTSTAETEASTSEPVAINFERIRIDNASIDYQDLSQGSRYQLNKVNLESRDTNFDGQAFPLDLNFELLRFDAASGEEIATSLAINSTVAANLEAGNLQLTDINFSITPMLLQGQLTVNDFSNAPRFEGNLQSNSFDSMALLQSLGMMAAESEFTGTVAQSPQLSFGLSLNGDSSSISIPSFQLNLDQTEMEGDASIRLATDFAPMSISYDVISSALDLSPFMPATDESTTPQPEPDAADTSTPLPVELLNAFNLNGSISIESIVANEFLFEDINIFTNMEDGLLDLELQPARSFDGTVQASLRVDGRSTNPSWDFRFTTNNLNLVDLAPAVSRLNVTTGRLNLESSYTARGSTLEDLLDSVGGSTSFTVTENSVNIALIKQVFTAIVALSPNGATIQQWPDVIQFAEMGGYILLEEGLQSNQEIRLRMDNFDVSGTGLLDLEAGSFDYDMQFTVLGAPERQTIPINERFHNVTWPVDCSAEFSAEASQYCRPDFQRVREIFADLAAQAVRNRLQQELDNQVPNQLRDAARGLLNNLFDN